MLDESLNNKEVSMSASISDIKCSSEKYIDISAKSEIFIQKDGKTIEKLSNIQTDREKTARSLFGILPSNIDVDKERMDKFY